MKLKIMTFFLFCFAFVPLLAQNSIIKGTITDESTQPLPGVNIILKGTNTGTTTDFDGQFEISANIGQVLVVSYLGFVSQEITITSNNAININMVEDTSQLEEVIVIGYGQQKKESVLSAINQISGEEIVQSGSTNITNALSGISPGLVVVQDSGQPGADDGDLFIRGNANPLILVDGVEIVGGFANINPRDVESISTLKDGAATAVYGIRGANGVIIITTKRGKIGRPVVSFNSEFAVKSVLNKPDNILNAFSAQSAFNQGILNDQAYNSGWSTEEDLGHWRDGDLPYIYPNVDWVDLSLRDYATSLNQTISLRGGSDFVKYYASFGYLNEGDIIKTEQLFDYDPKFNFKRYSFRGNLDFTLTKTTVLKTSVSSRLEDTSQPGTGANNNPTYLGIYTTPPGGRVPYYPASVMEEYPDPLYPGVSEFRFGPTSFYIQTNANGKIEDTKTVFSIDLELEQELDFVTKGLSFLGKYNYISSYTTRSSISRTAPNGFNGVNSFTLGRDGTWTANDGIEYQNPPFYTKSNDGIQNSQDISYFRGQLNYNRSFGKHNVTGLGIFSRNKYVNNATFPFFNEDWVSRFTYNFNSKYFLEVSGAYNGDETFAEGFRFKFFPSYALGINLAKEKFIKDNLSFINNFKIRYSYGETGEKSGLNGRRWQYLSYYSLYGVQPGSSNPASPAAERRQTSRYQFGLNVLWNPSQTIRESTIGNDELTWATVTKENIGIEFGLFKNKISGEVDFFKETRTGLIENSSTLLPDFYGFTADLPLINYGSRESKGYEISLTYKNSISEDFKYTINAFYAFNNNRVTLSAQDGPGTPPYATISGKPVGASALLQTDGYFQNIDELVNYPTLADVGLGDYRYIDYNSNGIISNDSSEGDQIRFDLPNAPRNTYSFTLGFNYKAWSLNALFNGVFGHKGLINQNLAFALPGGEVTGLEEHLDYWTPSNTDARFPALHALSNPNVVNTSTARIIDLDYFKLRSLNLGYNFDMSNSKSISNLNLYINGNNLFVISDIIYGNPESNAVGYPLLRRINLGLNMTF